MPDDPNNRWWYSGESLGFVYVEAASWDAAVAAVSLLPGQTDIFWGESLATPGPWMDFFFDGAVVSGSSANSEGGTGPWGNVTFPTYQEAYDDAQSVLENDPDFASAFESTPPPSTCDAQELVIASSCFYSCVTGQLASAMEVALLCVIAGGVVPPPEDVTVIGGEGDNIIIGGEGVGMVEVEGS